MEKNPNQNVSIVLNISLIDKDLFLEKFVIKTHFYLFLKIKTKKNYLGKKTLLNL